MKTIDKCPYCNSTDGYYENEIIQQRLIFNFKNEHINTFDPVDYGKQNHVKRCVNCNKILDKYFEKVAESNNIAIIHRIQNEKNKKDFLYNLSILDKNDLKKILTTKENGKKNAKTLNKYINDNTDLLNFYDNLSDAISHLKELGIADKNIIKDWEVNKHEL